MNNTFKGKILIINDLTGKEYSFKNDILFTVEGSTITVSFPENTIVETSDLDDDGKPIFYRIFKKFDREILWDFGDGTIVKGLTATHTYKVSGSYSITCTCFDSDENPYINNYPKIEQTVKVVDILPTILSYTNSYLKKVEAGLLNNVHAGEIVEVAEVLSTLDKSITEHVPIKCYTVKSNSNNIFDLPQNNLYQHLLPYNTFLTEDKIPTLSIVPGYKDVYVVFTSDKNNSITLDLYIVDPTYLPPVIVEKIAVDSDIPYPSTTRIIKTLDEISTLNYYYIGQSGKASIFFQDDLPCEEDMLNFVLDTDYFPEKNIPLSKDTVNLVSIGTELRINKNVLTGNELIFISTNGLTTANNSENHPIYDLSLNNNNFSFFRAKYLGIESPFVLRIISNKDNPYFIKDCSILNVVTNKQSILPVDSAEIEYYMDLQSMHNNIPYMQFGSCFGTLKALIETNEETSSFDITVTLDNNKTYTLNIENLTYIDLKSFTDKNSKYYLDPQQNYTDYSAKEVWEIYKTHPVFENIPILDKYMLGILESNDFLEKVINKGNNFVDDFGNINTCSIKNLISICESINLNLDLYNNENFSQPEIINQLLKIFSINHSRLVGTKFKVKDEFETEDHLAGKNRGPQIDLYQKIYVSEENWPKIVCYDRYAKKYFLLNTALLKKVRLSPLKTDEHGTYFQLIDYFETWGWNLLLGENEKYIYKILSPNKELFQMLNLLIGKPHENKAGLEINKFYFFYEYIETTETDIHNSYLKPETISENIKDYNTWYKADGSIDRLLYKTLIENLDLN